MPYHYIYIYIEAYTCSIIGMMFLNVMQRIIYYVPCVLKRILQICVGVIMLDAP